MTNSIAQVNKEAQLTHKTMGQTKRDFSIGDRVEVISACVDFTFFREGVRGTVVRFAQYEDLGIIVQFDDGDTFNFSGRDLKIIKSVRVSEDMSTVAYQLVPHGDEDYAYTFDEKKAIEKVESEEFSEYRRILID